MNRKTKYITLALVLVMSTGVLATNKTVKKIVKYRKKTTVDLTGSVIKSKARTPDVFYVFRRKRTLGGKLKKLPENFNYHNSEIYAKALKAIK